MKIGNLIKDMYSVAKQYAGKALLTGALVMPAVYTAGCTSTKTKERRVTLNDYLDEVEKQNRSGTDIVISKLYIFENPKVKTILNKRYEKASPFEKTVLFDKISGKDNYISIDEMLKSFEGNGEAFRKNAYVVLRSQKNDTYQQIELRYSCEDKQTKRIINSMIKDKNKDSQIKILQKLQDGGKLFLRDFVSNTFYESMNRKDEYQPIKKDNALENTYKRKLLKK